MRGAGSSQRDSVWPQGRPRRGTRDGRRDEPTRDVDTTLAEAGPAQCRRPRARRARQRQRGVWHDGCRGGRWAFALGARAFSVTAATALCAGAAGSNSPPKASLGSVRLGGATGGSGGRRSLLAGRVGAGGRRDRLATRSAAAPSRPLELVWGRGRWQRDGRAVGGTRTAAPERSAGSGADGAIRGRRAGVRSRVATGPGPRSGAAAVSWRVRKARGRGRSRPRLGGHGAPRRRNDARSVGADGRGLPSAGESAWACGGRVSVPAVALWWREEGETRAG